MARLRQRLQIAVKAAALSVAGVLALLVTVGLAVDPSRVLSVWIELTDRPAAVGLSDLRLLTMPGLLGQPRWSPDGRLVAYVEFEEKPSAPPDPNELPMIDEKEFVAYLTAVPAEGGRPRRLVRLTPPQDLFDGNQFAWMPDSRALVWAETEQTGTPRTPECAIRVRTIPASTGQATLPAIPSPCVSTHKALLSADSLALSARGTEMAVLVSQRLVTGWKRTLGIVSLDSGTLRALPVFTGSAQRQVALSDLAWQGGRIYFTAQGPRREVSPPGPDGKRITVPTHEVWSIGQDGEDLRRETSGPDDVFPAPRPGSSDLAFVGNQSLCLRGADGQTRTLLRVNPSDLRRGFCAGPVSWSPDGKKVAFTWIGQRSGAAGIWVGEPTSVPKRGPAAEASMLP